jgi:predicted dehydrogenase
MRVGIIGCGNISGIYLRKMIEDFPNLQVVACADLEPEKAQSRAEEFGIRAWTPEAMLEDPDTEIVVNLTTPDAHAPLCRKVLEAGKHAYVEKPLSAVLEEGRGVVELARSRGLRLGCAPDTFLGSGNQTCRTLIDGGAVGKVVGATAFMLCPGHERWHPNPEFYYKIGGGPVFDMGPYYITALVNLLGPVAGVTSMAAKTFDTRTIGSEPKKGTKVAVEVYTHYVGCLEFECGALGSMVMSFDSWGGALPSIEVYGTEGTLSVPNPNIFGGPVRLKAANAEWEEIPLDPGFHENSRGLGVAEMASAVRQNRSHRASGELGQHVLEVMTAFDVSARTREYVAIESRCDRPEPFDGTLE